ncbi:hypothetical protein HanIR_Chr17g0877441 [Helianthus annuus]|nr:hypothetical protein HanIR_Chr17g0877441 [Helianthus annuus]
MGVLLQSMLSKVFFPGNTDCINKYPKVVTETEYTRYGIVWYQYFRVKTGTEPVPKMSKVGTKYVSKMYPVLVNLVLGPFAHPWIEILHQKNIQNKGKTKYLPT